MPDLLIVSLRRGLSQFGIGSLGDDEYFANSSQEEYTQLKDETASVLHWRNFRQTAGTGEGTVSAPRFDDVVGNSFLPLIIDLGRTHNFRPVFVRVQRRPNADGSIASSASLDRYIENLRDYLEAEDAGFIDMNGVPDIRLEHYAHTDHIKYEYMGRYTEIFFQEAISEFGLDDASGDSTSSRREPPQTKHFFERRAP